SCTAPSIFPLQPSFSFTHPATTDIYPLSLHDALPISSQPGSAGRAPLPLVYIPDGIVACAEAHGGARLRHPPACVPVRLVPASTDRKSTRLNSSHVAISYAVFCLKKKIQNNK